MKTTKFANLKSEVHIAGYVTIAARGAALDGTKRKLTEMRRFFQTTTSENSIARESHLVGKFHFHKAHHTFVQISLRVYFPRFAIGLFNNSHFSENTPKLIVWRSERSRSICLPGPGQTLLEPVIRRGGQQWQP